MNDTITIAVNLFGPLKKYSSLTLTVPQGTTVKTLREKLGEVLRKVHPSFSENGLLAESAFATDERILVDSSEVSRVVNVLPPVCGG